MKTVKKGKDLYITGEDELFISPQDNYYFQKECTTIDKA